MLKIDIPPLVSFRIDFKFEKSEKISFEMMANVEKLLQKSFPVIPSIKIIEYPYDTKIEIGIPIQIGPIRFQNEDKNAQIQLFSNGLIFLYNKYSHWKEVKENIIEILFKTCEILKIDSIDNIRIEYIDEFLFPIEKFKLSDKFNLNLNIPEDWKLDFRDFHMGISIITEESDKFIIRLRGLLPKDEHNYLFRLESVYLKKSKYLINQKNEIISILDTIHDLIDDHFLNIMSEQLQKELGVRIE